MSGLLHDAVNEIWMSGGPALSSASVARLANLTAEATARTATLARTLDALAALIADDENGVFSTDNTTDLLLTLSQAADGIAALYAIGEAAIVDAEIRTRKR